MAKLRPDDSPATPRKLPHSPFDAAVLNMRRIARILDKIEKPEARAMVMKLLGTYYSVQPDLPIKDHETHMPSDDMN